MGKEALLGASFPVPVGVYLAVAAGNLSLPDGTYDWA